MNTAHHDNAISTGRRQLSDFNWDLYDVHIIQVSKILSFEMKILKTGHLKYSAGSMVELKAEVSIPIPGKFGPFGLEFTSSVAFDATTARHIKGTVRFTPSVFWIACTRPR